MEVAANFAANYLEEMYQVQNELIAKYPNHSDLVMAIAGGNLNKQLPLYLENLAKKNNRKESPSSMYMVFSIATTKLGFLAQQFGLVAASGCHFKEARNLENAANGGEPIMANCRLAAYGNIEARALRMANTKEAKAITELVGKWVRLNVLFSESSACALGYCI